ncbi:MAG: hypothetical protein EBS18_02460 [Actinobacteria bacterium]|nr:hypothetical protein [Actinomycetota bacterium]
MTIDDMDVEIRVKELLLAELKIEINKFIEKIEAAKINSTNEWEDGLNAGLEWAIRILRGDKSAS